MKDHLLDLPEGKRFPKLREFILVEIVSKGRHGGWLLACNRCYSEGTSPIARQPAAAIDPPLWERGKSVVLASNRRITTPAAGSHRYDRPLVRLQRPGRSERPGRLW